MKILVIIPNSGMSTETLAARKRMLLRAASADADITVRCITAGPVAVESNTDEVIAGPEVLKMAVQGEKEGFDAIVIYCFSDVGINAVRENVQIPVIGPGETSLAIAGMISNRFSVITTTDKNISRTYRRLMMNPIAREKMKSVIALNVPVKSLRESPDKTREYLRRACRQATERDFADTVILGCLGMADYGKEIERECNIKVIDPAFISLGFAEMCVRLNIVPSRKTIAAFEGTMQGGSISAFHEY